MAGLVPAIHVLLAGLAEKDVDARHKAGHDEKRSLSEHRKRSCGQEKSHGALS
jgi:hypothetical protein